MRFCLRITGQKKVSSWEIHPEYTSLNRWAYYGCKSCTFTNLGDHIPSYALVWCAGAVAGLAVMRIFQPLNKYDQTIVPPWMNLMDKYIVNNLEGNSDGVF